MNSQRDAAWGVFLGLIAATGYSITNLALRKLATGDGGLTWDLFVSGTKALPTAMAATGLLLLRWRKGESTIPPWSLLWPLILTAIVMQFGGNVGFQLALRAIGLAITVPIVFASLIVSGAVAGRIVLGDPVSRRTFASMTLMVVSIAFLSAAASQTESAINNPEPIAPNHTAVSRGEAGSLADLPGRSDSESVNPLLTSVEFGVTIALISGLSYGLCGVMIRRVVREALPVASTLFVFSITGLVMLWPISVRDLGFDGVTAISGSDWFFMVTAGVFNAVAFFAITHSMRYLTMSRTNVVNASQNAMCAVGAFVFFAEPMTPMTLAGIGLTIAGLLILDRK